MFLSISKKLGDLTFGITLVRPIEQGKKTPHIQIYSKRNVCDSEVLDS